MAKQTRCKTKYPGVYYVNGKALSRSGNEKIYYIRYRRNGKSIEEKIGRQYVDNMTPSKASGIRSKRLEGVEQSNNAKRTEQKRKKWTISKLWEAYSDQLANGANRTDKTNWSKYLEKPFGEKEPNELTKLDTDRIRIKLLKTKSPQTVKHVLALLRRIINYGINSGIVAPLPFKITLPAVDNIKTEDLNQKQIQSLLKALEKTQYTTAATMMKLALYSGMRRGEIFKLKWKDVDFERGFITIFEPKGGKTQKIPLNENSRTLLKAIPESESEFIFPARGGGPRKDISKDTRAIKKEAGLPDDFRPLHGLRHVYATMLASSGKVDMFTLQKLLTHKSPEMTQRYAHHRDEALKRAADQVDDILSEVTTMKEEKQA